MDNCATKCEKDLYTIGEVSKECKVSKKTLRFYEQLGIILPDKVCPENGYRYYSRDTMNLIPIIKYYKQMGFKLQEMSGVQASGSYFYHEYNFVNKLDELKKEEQEIKNRYTAVYDWHDLLREGTMAIENQIQDVSIKYLDKTLYYGLEQDFSYDYKEAVINIPWVNYLEENNCAITGPVILNFPSYEKKKAGEKQKAWIIQQPVGLFNPNVNQKEFGGMMYASLYHLGDPATIAEKYTKVEEWARQHEYICGPECYERYVIDYWATRETNKFVTEILIPISKVK